MTASEDAGSAGSTTDAAGLGVEDPIARYQSVRDFSDHLCEPLEIEDYVVQTMADVSPTKWHLAHTSWFFETFILASRHPGYESPNPAYNFLFNSYYNTVGKQFFRPQRGLITRPTVADVRQYRRHVDESMVDLLDGASSDLLRDIYPVLDIGLNHEQQHQELILTDIKHVFSRNPLYPTYREGAAAPGAGPPADIAWSGFPEGIQWVGYDGDGFAYDNESPRHRVFIESFELANRLVTNREYLEFMNDGGYGRSELWLSLGWATVQQQGWQAPMYWEQRDGRWRVFTLGGLRDVDPASPVCHVSMFEADAYARWAGARLPSEAEWEVASDKVEIEGNFVDDGRFHPAPFAAGDGVGQMFGDVWEWTRSQYSPYPGYSAAEGALGEYNGKFMCNQFVLRGGSCATTRSHVRRTYRNFFPPDSRWQFMGFRLARDGEGVSRHG